MFCMKIIVQLNTGVGRLLHPLQNAQYSRVVSHSLQHKLGLPEGPKRPLSPFIKYVMEQRPSVVKENPKLSQPEIVKKISASWKQLDTTVKDPMQQKYKGELSEYLKQSQKYLDSLSAEKKEEIQRVLKEAKEKRLEKKIKTEKKNLGKPKRPTTTFSLFLKDKLAESGSKSNRQLFKKISEEWRSCSQQEKDRYTKKYEEEKKKYLADIQNWEKKMIENGRNDLVRRKSAVAEHSSGNETSHKQGSTETAKAHHEEKGSKGRGKKTVEKK